jgi:hypothetical protein
VKGLRKLAKVIHPEGRVFFGVYGKAFFREQYLTETLRDIFGGQDNKTKVSLLKQFNITRQALIKDIKKENKFLKHLSALKGDLSFLGYELFPHQEDSLHMDGFCHPSVKYYDPDSLFHDVEAAGLEIERFLNFDIPKEWARSSFFQALTLKQQFQLVDACKLIPYSPICKIREVS